MDRAATSSAGIGDESVSRLREGLVIAESFFALPLSALVVRRVGVGPMVDAIEVAADALSRLPLVSRLLLKSAGLGDARVLARCVERSGKIALFRVDCLPLSLVTLWVLRRAGFEALLKIGARTLLGRFESHAWVEVDGEVVTPNVDDPRQIYTVLETNRWSDARARGRP